MLTPVQLTAKCGRESARHVPLTIHCALDKIVILDDEGNLGVTITLQCQGISDRNIYTTILTYPLTSIVKVGGAHLNGRFRQ